MNCPVCQATALPDDHLKCPQCESSLEAFHLTRKLEKSGKNRLGFGITATVLFLALLLIWGFTGISEKAVADADSADGKSQGVQVEKELSKLKQTNEALGKQVAQLKEQMATMVPKPEKRAKEYVVQNGESLFGIARKVYGNGFRYEDLARDNGIDHPENIRTGQKLIIYY